MEKNMTENEKNTELMKSEIIEAAIEESALITEAVETSSSEAAIGESTMAEETNDTSSSTETAPEMTELPAEPPWEREKVLEEDDLNAWIDADLARSGLTRNDIEIEPFKPEGTLVKRSNGGYKIIYRNAQGERFLGHNGKIFMRKRYRPPLPLSRDKVEMKYATDPGAGNHCYFPVSADAMDQLYNTDLPLILVEGEKKARKATISGVPMIGLAGIWNWLAPKSERRTVTDHYKINDDLVPFLSEGREVYIIYDSDSHQTRNKAKSFDTNTLRFASELLDFKCKLYRIDMPADGSDKCGLDDYLCKHTSEELVDYIEAHKELVPEAEALRMKDPYKDLSNLAGEPFQINYNKENKPTKVNFNQEWNARFFMQNHHVLFEPGEGTFYLYDDRTGLWRPESEDRIKTILADELREYWKKFWSAEAVALMPARTDRMLKDSINRLRGLCEKENAFKRDASKAYIHLPEGMLDLYTMNLEQFSPNFYSRNMIPIHLNENADCPQFMNDLLAHALSVEQIETLQKYCGMALLGHNLSQQFVILEGTAGGGKSTIAKLICDVIGEDNVATLRSDMLAERFEMSAFCGKTLLIANDVNSDYMRKKGTGVIKSLTGADTLDVEFKGSNKRVRLKGNFCIAITTNSRLRIRLDEDGDAWLRRLILIRFVNPPPEKKIPNFAQKLLQEEGSGILNWFIAGAIKLLEDCKEFGRIKLPDSLQEEANALVEESNTVHNFLEEQVVADETQDVTTQELMNAYTRYCNNNNLNSLPSKIVMRSFAKLIPEKFGAYSTNTIERWGSRTRGYRKIMLVG
jgi:P4 family phage/plasmid primase-like protien